MPHLGHGPMRIVLIQLLPYRSILFNFNLKVSILLFSKWFCSQTIFHLRCEGGTHLQFLFKVIYKFSKEICNTQPQYSTLISNFINNMLIKMFSRTYCKSAKLEARKAYLFGKIKDLVTQHLHTNIHNLYCY